ncbi:hypothetical protein ABKN59_007955 [Abortiporus biennis]
MHCINPSLVSASHCDDVEPQDRLTANCQSDLPDDSYACTRSASRILYGLLPATGYCFLARCGSPVTCWHSLPYGPDSLLREIHLAFQTERYCVSNAPSGHDLCTTGTVHLSAKEQDEASPWDRDNFNLALFFRRDSIRRVLGSCCRRPTVLLSSATRYQHLPRRLSPLQGMQKQSGYCPRYAETSRIKLVRLHNISTVE